jgi:hypothetical protein
MILFSMVFTDMICHSGSNALNWIQQHQNIFIPVVSVAGLLLLCCILGCCCRNRRRLRNRPTEYMVTGVYPPYVQQPPPAVPYGHYATPPPPNAHHDNWVDPSAYNGPAPYSSSPVGRSRSTPNQDGYEMTPPDRWRTPSPAHFGSMRQPTPSSTRRMNEGLI